MSEEIWKDIPDYEGLYEASSHGRVRSKEGKVTYSEYHGERVWKSRILKEKNPSKKGRRDKRVDLWKDGKPKTLLVSRIIATTFIHNTENKKFVNHIDGDHRNNHIENLEWSTYTENNNHAFDNDLMTTNIRITLIRTSNQESHSFRSMSKASEFIGRNTGYVSLRLQRNYETAVDVDGHEYRIIIPD